MVRTKETAGLKVGVKAPRKGLSGPSTSASSSSAAKKPRGEDSGGNPVCPRETPAWQKPITDFFRQSAKTEEDGTSAKENLNPEENRESEDDASKCKQENNDGDNRAGPSKE